ncbi:hypothetical protein BX666DRAFT_2021713 [Dichotomocladium elegans]|nr:hypothetical protein BX666DRAFT_2021713 [Dichotomocladium elegans]
MGLGMDKCCCLIPLRLGTFIIALWFFIIYLIDVVTGFMGSNAVTIYSGQAAKAWYYIGMIFAVVICVGGLFGILGSLFASRKFAKTFSVVAWTCCVLSIAKYLVSLIIMVVHRDELMKSCRRSGFVGFNNNNVPLSQAVLTDSSYYSPVRYPGTLNANATSAEQCQSSVQTFLVAFGVVIFLIEVLQIYFAKVVTNYASRLRNGARHHRLHDQQIKDFEESRYHMSTVY